MELIIITGLSGAGRRSVLETLEDLGCMALDNVPVRLLESLLDIETKLNPNRRWLAVGMDSRHSEFTVELAPMIDRFLKKSIPVYIIFVEANVDIIVRRFSELRRPHFLDHNGSLVDAIIKEKATLESVRTIANAIIDTTCLNLSQLRQHIIELLPNLKLHGTTLRLISFGFKYSIPSDINMVLDARFLPNPYYIPALRDLTGDDDAVQKFLIQFEIFNTFVDTIESWLKWTWPHIKRDGRIYYNVAIGCTGGHHRSVAIVNILGQRLREMIPKLMIHHKHLNKLNK